MLSILTLDSEQVCSPFSFAAVVYVVMDINCCSDAVLHFSVVLIAQNQIVVCLLSDI